LEKRDCGSTEEVEIKLPQKRYYRQRAHANPMSDHDLDYPRCPEKMNWSEWFDGDAKRNPIEFADIGCGYGGLLMRLSPLYPHVSMVGMEIRVKVSDFVQDKIAALRSKSPGQFNNICCIRTNAMKYLPNYFNQGQLSKMFFLYPDPHFKKVKHKHRIISTNLLAEYAFVLRPGGYLYTITDVEELHNWMVERISEHPLFRRLDDDETGTDPVVLLLSESTEEGQKVSRNEGKKHPAVFVRLENPPPSLPLA